MSSPVSAAGPSGAGGPLRVMIVDDSAVVRGLTKRWLEAEPDIQVVESVGNGAIAVRAVERSRPEIVILDIEMPEMDGMTALPELLKIAPDLRVIMASTLTERNATISIQALSKGACDYVPKPASGALHAAETYRQDLIAKIRGHGASRRRARKEPPATARPNIDVAVSAKVASAPSGNWPTLKPGEAVKTRPLPAALLRPEVIAIGSSTGGPQALFAVMGVLKTQIGLPILITQHMPPTFTTILAEHLGRISGLKAAEAKDGEPVTGGRIYVAPGDFHMTVQSDGLRKQIKLNQDPPENFCRPAVDPMFRSIAKVFGSRVLAIVLTGMGGDGAQGARPIVDAGGVVIAQNEATSVVWGMPGAVTQAGLAHAVLPLDEIGPAILRVVGGGRP